MGSNLDPQRHLAAAARTLLESFTEVVFSSVYQSPAEGFEGPPFHNLAAGLTTGLDPAALKLQLRAIEAAHGRSDSQRGFRSRTLDLDLLLYLPAAGGQDSAPDQDILRYAFVCVPLAELIPDFVHPGRGRPLAELCAKIPGSQRLQRVALDLG